MSTAERARGGIHSLLVLVVVFAGCAASRPVTRLSDCGEPTGPATHGYEVPGRKPGSELPWELFLGNAAHRLIAYMYRVNHPQSSAFYNKESIASILRRSRVGDPSRLHPDERELRPDITDVTSRSVFEIKPWHDQGLLEGQQKVQAYLAALNRATPPGNGFSRGTGFHGEVLIRFAHGQYIWRLKWQTTQPGVVQYRWTRSQERFGTEAAAYRADQWVELAEQELQQYGGWVGRAVDDMVSRRERLESFSGAVGITIDLIGDVAVGVFSGSLLGRMNTPPGPRQPMHPPAQGGAKVIPFPSPAPSTAPSAPRPAASGM